MIDLFLRKSVLQIHKAHQKEDNDYSILDMLTVAGEKKNMVSLYLGS